MCIVLNWINSNIIFKKYKYIYIYIYIYLKSAHFQSELVLGNAVTLESNLAWLVLAAITKLNYKTNSSKCRSGHWSAFTVGCKISRHVLGDKKTPGWPRSFFLTKTRQFYSEERPILLMSDLFLMKDFHFVWSKSTTTPSIRSRCSVSFWIKGTLNFKI